MPVYDLSASAGYGAVIDQETEVYSLAFPPAYLKRLTSSSPGNLAIISVKGESMEPTLLDDDIVLLDASKTNLSFDGLFVLRFNDALHVKRVGRSVKRGHVMIISDNRELYPPLDAAVDDIEPVGKVLWYGRKV
ncbi:S24 family peptidase [Pseudooceanicola atlanticus]|uniref:S24 family peptidase n=1 Tax=Pseudooceanicola atlanticus TaxID=1461694 RepID=UPI003B503040